MVGPSSIEHALAKVGHYGLYAFMTIMPASGIAMGYYGGNYVAGTNDPFFLILFPCSISSDEQDASFSTLCSFLWFFHI